MKNYEMLHDVEDQEKVERLVKAILAGEKISPIVVVEDSETSLTGVHRLAAYQEVYRNHDDSIEIPVVEVSQEDFQAAIEACYCEYFSEIHDMEEYCRALYKIVDSEEVKTALKDQF